MNQESQSENSNRDVTKCNIILDVKPWDDETNLEELENNIRQIKMEGLEWGEAILVPLAYGIRKLQMCCVIEEEKVDMDVLTQTIEDMEAGSDWVGKRPVSIQALEATF